MNERPPTTAQYLEPEEIGLRDFWFTLVKYRKWVLGIPVLAVVSAVIMVLFVPKQWEARAVIQLGQVGKSGLGQDSPLIESPARAVARMKLATFEDAVLTSLKIPLNKDTPLEKLYRNSLKVKFLPNTDLIELKVRAYSRGEAKEWAEETVNQLRKAHQRVAEPSIGHLQSQLAEVKKDIHRVQEERNKLLANVELKEKLGPGNRFAESVLFANILSQKDADLRNFALRRLALEEQLSPVRTYATELLDQVFVPETPIIPKKLLVVMLAGVAGLFVGILVAFLLNYIRATSKDRPTVDV